MNTTPSENHPDEGPILEGNIARLIASVGRLPTGVEESLLGPVLAEVRRERRRLLKRRALTAAIASIAATAATLVIVVFVVRNPPQPQVQPPVAEVARVNAVSGLASLRNGGIPRALAGREGVRAGQWLETAWGSRADLVLADQSALVVQPHTRLQINRNIRGEDILLEQGQISLEVAKQPPDKVLTITTPESQVTVVGTALDVQVLTKPRGRKQTWVDVRSGRVEFASGGQRVVLLPNMQGMADEGEPPIARSQTAEVNELARLAARLPALAAEAGIPSGSAAIVEFNSDRSATLWSLVGIANATQADLKECFLECDAPDCTLEAFTPQGARLPVAAEAGRWRIDWSADPLPPGGQRSLVVKVGNLPGLFAAAGPGVFEFTAPAAEPARLSLLQIRLPSAAHVEEMVPAPVESRRSLSRLVLTISSHFQLPQVVRRVPR